MVENVLFAQLVAHNCRWLDFGGCVFTKSFMSKADKRDGLSREGSARVAIYKRTDLTHIYTLESSYNTGRLVNRLEPIHVPKDADKRQVRDLSPPPPPPAKGGSIKYSPETWGAVGRALAISVLDLAEANPLSRLGPSGGGGLTRLRGVVGAWCRTEARKEAAKALKAAFKGGAAKANGGGGGSGRGGDGGGDDEDGVSGGSGDEDDLDEPEMRGEEEEGLSEEEVS